MYVTGNARWDRRLTTAVEVESKVEMETDVTGRSERGGAAVCVRPAGRNIGAQLCGHPSRTLLGQSPTPSCRSVLNRAVRNGEMPPATDGRAGERAGGGCSCVMGSHYCAYDCCSSCFDWRMSSITTDTTTVRSRDHDRPPIVVDHLRQRQQPQ